MIQEYDIQILRFSNEQVLSDAKFVIEEIRNNYHNLDGKQFT